VPTAFVLVNTKLGSESDVLREFKGMEGIEEALLVYGLYDIILRVVSNSMDELKRTITWKIRKIENVTATQTVIML